jgi:hypothetical protein
MLHVSDIEKRLSLCPEPPEVTEMRERVIDAFKNLEFFEGPHKYLLHKTDGTSIELPSVSSVVQRFEPEVDWDEIRIKKAEREGIDPDVLKRMWRENNLKSTSNGTIVHEFGESCLYFFQGRFDEMVEYTKQRQFEDGYLIPYGPKQIACSKLYEDILNNYNVWPVMAEAKVHSGYNDILDLGDNNYCGTLDMLFAGRGKDGKIRPFIMDYKTNKDLYNDYNRNYQKMMLPPFDFMVDEPYSHYTIQLSLYSWCLEQLGYEMTHRIIVWLKEDGTYEKLPVDNVIPILKQVM